MLLKMAYIQEGLGQVGQSLYYLRLYELTTHDHQAIEKMQELSNKYSLTGFEDTDSNRLVSWITQNLVWIQLVLIGILLLLTVIIYLQRRKKQKPYSMALLASLFIIGLLYVNNFLSNDSVITNQHQVYLMEGPSAGSSVAGIVRDGNQLQVLGKNDIWLKVKWNDKVVFVKENNVLHVFL
jgi:uncharacterized protein YgiM (DUF1202 family)